MQLTRITRHIPRSSRTPKWHIVDAKGQRIGRLATHVATLLQGKHLPDFSRHDLVGDFVIVVNASGLDITPKKAAQKTYYHHSGYIGGMRVQQLSEVMAKHPDRVVMRAVRSMLPGNRLARAMLRRLKVYATATHPHEAQINAGLGKPKSPPPAPAPAAKQGRRGAPAEPSPTRRAPRQRTGTPAVPPANGEKKEGA